MRLGTFTLLACASACTWVSSKDYDEARNGLDEDGDSVPFKDDCDDQDPLRGLGLPEVPYDAIDNDCLPKDAVVDPLDVDVDRDLSPGISEEDYAIAAAAAKSPLKYPSSYVGKAIDCDDSDPAAFPGNLADDDFYDGIDTDCDQTLDFDRDGDGYFAEYADGGPRVTQAMVDAFIAKYQIPPDVVDQWGPDNQGGPQPGDCDERLLPLVDGASIYPGAMCDRAANIEDCPYSGFDENCDGADDFDIDQDGHVAVGFEVPWGNFNREYKLGLPQKPFDDCADGPDLPPGLDLADAALVYPRDEAEGFVDPPYDGVDADCLRDDDYDQDGDEHIADENVAARDAMVIQWGYELEPWATGPAGDCNDLDPSTHQDRNDVLWNSIDENCDAFVDNAYFNFGDGALVASTQDCTSGFPGKGTVCWVGVTNPEVLFFNNDSFAVFVGAAQAWRFDPADPLAVFPFKTGATMRFPFEDAIGPAALVDYDDRSWVRALSESSSQLLSTHMDLSRDSTPNGSVCSDSCGAGSVCDWVSVGGTAERGIGEINGSVLFAQAGTQFSTQPQSRSAGEVEPFGEVLDNDTSNYEDSGDRGLFIQCGPEALLGKVTTEVYGYESASFRADTCFFYDKATQNRRLVEVCWQESCQVVEFTDAGLTFTARPDIDVSGDAWVWGDWEDGITLLIDGSGASFVRADDSTALTAVFSGEDMRSFDAELVGSILWSVGITNDRRVVLERLDTITDAVQSVELRAEDNSNPSFVPTGASLALGNALVGDSIGGYTEEFTVAVAVVLEDLTAAAPYPASVGWTFLGQP